MHELKPSEELMYSTGVISISLNLKELTTVSFSLASPSNPPRPEFDVYKMFELLVTKLATGEEIGGTVNFRVSKDWLESRGYSPDDIMLLKYKGEWIEIPSSIAGEDESYVYYGAELKSFSLFAIVAKPKPTPTPTPEVTETPVQPTPAKTTPTPTPVSTPTEAAKPGFSIVLVIAIAIAAIVVIGYALKKRGR